MSEDPLTQLRQQLVDAGERGAEARAAAGRPRKRSGRRGLWLTLGAFVIAVPAGATAAGIINFDTTGSTPDGSTFTTGRITDDRAATDPERRDGIGRTCETTEVRDRTGELVSKGIACRPKNAPVSDVVIGAGFSVLPGDALLIQGSVAAQVTEVTISGYEQPIKLKPEPDSDRRSFSAVVAPVAERVLVAKGDDGHELDRTTVSPGPAAR
jgi:hypothetical protein